MLCGIKRHLAVPGLGKHLSTDRQSDTTIVAAVKRSQLKHVTNDNDTIATVCLPLTNRWISNYSNMAAASGNSSDELSSSVLLPTDSAGSSVSSRLQEEYDELLRYAVVTPNVPLIERNNPIA